MGTYVGILQDTFMPQPIVHRRPLTTWTMGSDPISCQERPQGQGWKQGVSGLRQQKAYGPPWQVGLSLLRRGGVGMSQGGEHVMQQVRFDRSRRRQR